jgi:putative hemolysin
VIGYVLRDDVTAKLWDKQPIDIAGLLRQPLFFPEAMPAVKALEEMRRKQLPLAIVVEEHGGMAGIVTIEDLVEEVVGELLHERDPLPPDAFQREADGAWLVPGPTDVRDVERRLGIEFPESASSRTLNGLIVELAGGRLPDAGETFPVRGGAVEVVDVSPRRVRTARIRLAFPRP